MRRFRVFLVALACVSAIAATTVAVANADTHTGFQLVIYCPSVTFTVVTPNSPAAAAQDISSTNVLVVAVGDIVSASAHFPENQVMTCTFISSKGELLTFPFLIAPASH